MKDAPEFGERLWGRHHDESRDLSGTHHLLHRRCHFPRKAVFFNLMPVDRLDRAALAGVER